MKFLGGSGRCARSRCRRFNALSGGARLTSRHVAEWTLGARALSGRGAAHLRRCTRCPTAPRDRHKRVELTHMTNTTNCPQEQPNVCRKPSAITSSVRDREHKKKEVKRREAHAPQSGLKSRSGQIVRKRSHSHRGK